MSAFGPSRAPSFRADAFGDGAASHDPWLDGFRRRCDPLADAAVAEVVARGRATMRQLLPAVEHLADEGSPACARFVAQTGAMAEIDDRPFEAGRRMFERNGLLALFVGFTVLVESYAGAKDNKVLVMSGRLGRGGAFRRMVETADFVARVVAPGGLRAGAPGVRALLSVRLLHARVRQHCRHAGYDVARFDEPVNQEAMIGTLMLFSLGVLEALTKLGVRITDEEKRSYYALWRHAGRLLGIDDALLAADYDGALVLYQRLADHQYWPDDDTRVLFEAAVEGTSRGARELSWPLQLAGAGLLRSPTFLRGLTAACVEPRLARFLVGEPALADRATMLALRTIVGALDRVHDVPGLRSGAAAVQARLFRRTVAALLRERPAKFDDPGFYRASAADVSSETAR